VEQTREPGARLSPPPPLEANDQLVTGVITAGWATALVVLLIIRGSLRADVRWWIWTCVAGLALGLFGLWYLPRLKRARTRSAQSAPRDNGSKTVSSTDTPGKSTRS
jgi:phosphate/sulfate permease